ncbi:epidermal growth factor-like protein 7 isoform X1, partial [Clarias magur]
MDPKLEMVLAPFSTHLPPEEDMANTNGHFLLDRTDFLSDQTNFLSHSLRQLDRIDSLSEQVSFLEERLGS